MIHLEGFIGSAGYCVGNPVMAAGLCGKPVNSQAVLKAYWKSFVPNSPEEP